MASRVQRRSQTKSLYRQHLRKQYGVRAVANFKAKSQAAKRVST